VEVACVCRGRLGFCATRPTPDADRGLFDRCL
jgi:hypothetical protein